MRVEYPPVLLHTMSIGARQHQRPELRVELKPAGLIRIAPRRQRVRKSDLQHVKQKKNINRSPVTTHGADGRSEGLPGTCLQEQAMQKAPEQLRHRELYERSRGCAEDAV